MVKDEGILIALKSLSPRHDCCVVTTCRGRMASRLLTPIPQKEIGKAK